MKGFSGSSTDPIQSGSPRHRLHTHTYSSLSLHMLLPFILMHFLLNSLLTLQNPLQMSPPLRSLPLCLQAELIFFLCWSLYQTAYLIHWSASSTWILGSLEVLGTEPHPQDDCGRDMNQYTKEQMVESGSDELQAGRQGRKEYLRVVSKLSHLPKDGLCRSGRWRPASV